MFIHGVCHITCDIPKFVESGDDKFFKYLGDEFEKHPTYANIAVMPVAITGILMVVFMIIAFLLATHWFRRSMVKLPWPLQRLTGFNAFWYSHHLFVIVYALLMVHSIKLLLAGPWYKRTVWVLLTPIQTDVAQIAYGVQNLRMCQRSCLSFEVCVGADMDVHRYPLTFIRRRTDAAIVPHQLQQSGDREGGDSSSTVFCASGSNDLAISDTSIQK